MQRESLIDKTRIIGILLASICLGILVSYVNIHVKNVDSSILYIAGIFLWIWLLYKGRSGDLSTAFATFVFISPIIASITVPLVRVLEGRRDYLAMYFMIVGALLGSMVLYLSLISIIDRNRITWNRNTQLSIPIIFLIMYMVHGILIGIIHGNNLNYLIGDVYKVVIPILLFVILSTIPNDKIPKIFLYYYLGLLISQIVLLVGSALSSINRLTSAFPNDNMALYLGSLVLFWYSKRKPTIFIGLLGFMLAWVISIRMAYRSLLMIYLVLLFINLLLSFLLKIYGFNIRFFSKLLLVIISLSIGLLGYREIAPDSFNRAIGRFEAVTFDDALSDASLSSRVSEVQTIVGQINRWDVITFITGYGFGAQYLIPKDISEWIAELYFATDYQVHNIHVFYLSVLYRSGIIGIFFWIVIILVILSLIYHCVSKSLIAKRWDHLIVTLWTLYYFIAALIMASTFSIFERDFNWILLIQLSVFFILSNRDTKTVVSYV